MITKKKKVYSRVYDLTYCKHDQAICLAPGLFQSLKRGERKIGKLDTTYKLSDKESVRFTGFEPLNGEDLRLLQGLIALAGVDGMKLPPEPSTEIGQELRRMLETKYNAIHQDARAIETTVYNLLKEIGLTNTGKNIKNIKASLYRMNNITVGVFSGKSVATFHLLSHAIDKTGEKLWIALNPRLAATITGKGQYTRIEMAEIRTIKSDPTRLIHQRLCAWIDPGKARKVEIDTICNYVWLDKTSNVNTLKKRYKTAKKALAEIANLGWIVNEYASGKYLIKRPALLEQQIMNNDNN